MRKLTNILVVIDTRKAHQVALNRAAQVASVLGSSLHILAPNPHADSDSQKALETLAATLKQQGLNIHPHETWRRNLTDTVLHISQMEGCQLIIKDAKPEGMLAQAFGTPADWSLLRQSEVPVLLVKHDQPWEASTMMAAVNADKDDYHHMQLNHAILDHATAIASHFSAELHLASAYPTSRLPIQDHGDGITLEQSYQATCLRCAKDYKLDNKNIHVTPGSPETLIPELVGQQQARLLIVGTHARKGISALAIGNTAEQLISEVHTDMLIVQPEDHMNPLEEELRR